MVKIIGTKQATGLLLFVFILFLTNAVKAQSESDTSKKPVFSFIEQMPEYPGGQGAMIDFIRHNQNYPKKARKEQISGRVLVAFFIDEKGDIVDEKVIEGIGGGCDEEALRVVRLMPRWKPGKRDGVPDKVKYTLPFIFNL